MYKNTVPIIKNRHAAIRFRQAETMEYAAGVSVVTLTSGEYFAACKSQPILFTKKDGKLYSCAVLGLRENSNLFLDAGKKWYLIEYCPFFFKRYPFIYITLQNGFTLGYDADCNLVSESEGLHIFEENGEMTVFARNMISAMNKYESDKTFTENFASKLEELGLLKPFSRTLRVADEKYRIEGFFCVDDKKLAGLPQEVTCELVQNGFHNLISAHLISLSNFEKLALLQLVRGIGKSAE